MGLFNKKKKLPPKAPRRTASLPEFPKYESSHASEPVLPKYEAPSEDFSKFKMPEEAPVLKMPPPLAINKEFEPPRRAPLKPELLAPETEEFNPRNLDQFSTMPATPDRAPTNPIFVKIADYKKALVNLRDVKEILREAERLMANIQSLKAEEDKQLSSWHQEINEIKSKLMKIDRDLFEYK